MRTRWLVGAMVAAGLVAGCTRPHETDAERVQRQAAEDTKQVRQDLRSAGAEAQKAAEQLRTETKAAMRGAREGWKEGAPSAGGKAGKVDLNSASVAELEALPGITAVDAKRIVHARPFDQAKDVRRRGLVSGAEWDRIEDRVTAK